MSNGASSQSGAATDTTDRAKALTNAIYDILLGYGAGGQEASQHAFAALGQMLLATPTAKSLIDSFFSLVNDLLEGFFSAVSTIRHGLNDTAGAGTAEILNDILGTNFDASVLTPAGGGNATFTKGTAIGQAVLGALEQALAQGRGGGGSPGTQAAQTFAGFGTNLALQNAIIKLIGGCVPEVHLDDVSEIGDAVERSLGLGRLTRTALHPLVNTLIAEPYRQEMNVKYSPEILGAGELVKAWLASRLVQDDVMDTLRRHGFPDSQINELIEQGRKRLTAQEWNVLTAIGQQGSDPSAYDDQADGMDDDWIKLRQIYLTGQRLAPAAARVLSEVLNQIKGGWIDSTSLEKYLSKYNLPDDEKAFWRDAAGELQDVPRKRISEAQMLFLYEASQVTDDDVQQWAEDEGYSSTDVQRILTYFRLELIAKSNGISPAKAAHLKALHAEHTAYVTDEITGLWQRAPTQAELNYWVALLDSGARTKHDFVTELKALPTTGPAMPT